MSQSRLLQMRKVVREVEIANPVQRYALKILRATHPDMEESTDLVKQYVRNGASPRGAQTMLLGAKVRALVDGRYHVSPDDIRGLNAAQLRERLKAVPTLSADEVTQVDSAFDTLGITDSDTALVAQMLEVMTDQETAITFSLEPYASFHFDILDLFLTIPLAGFAAEETDFALGNIGLEARFGHSFGDTFAGGISYGLQFWSPTATEKANGLGLANLLWSPRYFHEYMTVAPYFVAGADLMFVTIQASVAYNMMFAVKGDPDFDQVHFLQYGASLAITAIPYIIISAELAGMVDIIDAPAYNNSLSLTAGLRFASSFVDIGVAFQVPLVQGDSSDYASFSGVSFGSPSSFNTIISATFGL